jgi:hypothetical protein
MVDIILGYPVKEFVSASVLKYNIASCISAIFSESVKSLKGSMITNPYEKEASNSCKLT